MTKQKASLLDKFMIQVWQAEHSTTVIRLNLLLAHGDGLLMPQDWTTAERLGYASTGSLVQVWRVLSAIAC